MDFLSTLHKPWLNYGMALGLGAVGGLAFAPLFIFPAILLAMGGIWFLLDKFLDQKASFQKIFCLGWWFGLGHFTVGLYWIAHALTVDLAAFWWLIPFSLLGIPAILSIFIGLVFMTLKLWPYGGFSRAIAFAAIWLGFEWLRGHMFTGFPWNLLGYTWAFSPEMVQLASLGGVYGLSLLTILLGISLPYIISKDIFIKKIVLSLYLLAAICWLWGKVRLDYPLVTSSQPLAIRLVQPNVSQFLKWDFAQKEANFKELLNLTAQASHLPLKAIIWPETAVSFFLEQEMSHRQSIAEKIPQNGLLFTGGLRRSQSRNRPMEIWNSLLVLNDKGTIVAYYDKSHLVPFGEYIPFRKWIDKLFGKGSIKKITAGMIDCTSGEGPKTILLPYGFAAFTGLVCYEAIFPRAVINQSQERPGWIINVTNDGWYGHTSGPYQHLEMSRFRAIEEGIPLVRAANTGVSAVFDAYGRSLGKLELGKKGVLDVFLPTSTLVPPLYARWGDWITFFLIVGTLSLAWILSFKERRVKKSLTALH